MKDYYQILGLESTASADDIRRAFKKLAMQHHPDRGGDNERFSEINEAYGVLGDTQKRSQYDSWGQSASSSTMHGAAYSFDNFFDLFGQHLHRQRRPATYRLQLWITLRDVAQAGSRVVAVATPRGTTRVEIHLPHGIEDGDSVRYPGIGPDGTDIVVTYRVHADAAWSREANNVTTEIAVPLWNLILGTTVTAACLDGTQVSITVPPQTQPGTVMRLKGQGLLAKNQSARGDMFVRIQTRLPDHIPDVIIETIRQHVQ